MYNIEHQKQIAGKVSKIKEIFEKNTFSFRVPDAQSLADCILTMEFFLIAVPFDEIVVNRIDGEVGICDQILAEYRLI